jgi:hypothetical protein
MRRGGGVTYLELLRAQKWTIRSLAECKIIMATDLKDRERSVLRVHGSAVPAFRLVR